MSSPVGTLGGYTVGITADRRSGEQAELLERRGARVIHGPTIRTLPLADDDRLRAATTALIERPPNYVVLTTGIGTRSWLDAAESRGMGDELLDALRQATIITRGPKAKGAAVTAGLEVTWNAPGARSSEIIDHLVETADPSARIAVQLDGGTNDHIAWQLRDAGFDVISAAIYRWTLPEDPSPALRLVGAVCDRAVDAVTFTAAPAFRNFATIAEQAGRHDDLIAAFRRNAVAAVCVGPACAEAAAGYGVTTPILPHNSRLGAMVQAYAASVAGRRRDLTLAGLPVRVQGRLVVVEGGEGVVLSDRERGVLDVLARKPGVVVSKPALLREVWGAGEADDHLVEVTVARLRQRLGPAGVGIETIVRRGYRLSVD
ncbi:MAG: uroporphyrinogen-III synthase [Actinobacteria bacterium]|nr:uroporphyrinogen-III synthase [Actinomycetota bacterium]